MSYYINILDACIFIIIYSSRFRILNFYPTLHFYQYIVIPILRSQSLSPVLDRDFAYDSRSNEKYRSATRYDTILSRRLSSNCLIHSFDASEMALASSGRSL